MDSRVPEIRKHLKKKLDAYRYEHTLGVEFTCQALAMRYGYDLDKADLAGLLHDSAKRFEDPVMLQKCLDRNIPVTAEEERDPSLLHAKLGAWMAEHKYEVDDPEIFITALCYPFHPIHPSCALNRDDPRRPILRLCGSLRSSILTRRASRLWRAFLYI